MTPDQIKDKLLFLEKAVGALRDESLANASHITSMQDDFVKVNTLFEDQDKLEALVEKYSQDGKKDGDAQNSLIDYLMSYTDISKKNFGEIALNLSELSEKDQEILAEFTYLKGKFKEMYESFSAMDKFISDIKNDLDLVKVNLSNYITQNNMSYNSLRTLVEESRKVLFENQRITSENTTNLDAQVQRFNIVIKDLQDTVQGNHFNMTNQLKNVTDKTQVMIDSKVKESEQPNHNLTDELTDLKTKFQSTQLDLQNASLRTSNTSTQVQIIEKKIENIYLILKKLELGS